MTFYELEKMCKRRKRVFILLIFVFILLIILFLSFIYFNKNFSKNPKQVIKKEHKKISKKTKKLKKIKNPKKIKKDIKYLPLIDLDIKENNVTLNTKKPPKIKKVNKNNNLLLIKTENLPSFNTCIELSKRYFINKDYKNALKWAKLANLQNKKDPISWIIAAKSLYKLGKKEEAIKLLKIYNSYYNNKKIKKLLKEFNEN